MQQMSVEHLDLAERTSVILRATAPRAHRCGRSELIRNDVRALMTDGIAQGVHEGQFGDGLQHQRIRGADGDGIEPFAAVHQLHIAKGQHGFDVGRIDRQVQLVDGDTLRLSACDGTGREEGLGSVDGIRRLVLVRELYPV